MNENVVDDHIPSKVICYTHYERVKPHIDGAWHSLVYVSLRDILCSSDDAYKDISRRYSLFMNAAIHQFISLCDVCEEDIIPETSPHISLSRPFILHQHEIEAFLEGLAKAFTLQRRLVPLSLFIKSAVSNI